MTARKEVHVCPPEFSAHLQHVGGTNRYDQPNFKLVWSQYGGEGGSYRAGGAWSVDEAAIVGYRDLLKGDGSPCWALLMFHEAVEYGTPENYYISNFDESTGLQILGEYPYNGRWEVLYNLKWTERVDDALVHHAMPLNYSIFDRLIPIIRIAKNISWTKTKTAYETLEAREEQEKTDGIERHLRDKAVTFKGAVSFHKQGIRSTEIDQRMMELQRAWSQLAQSARTLPKGTSTR